ncbi:MAG: methyltransferase domain-containing protein [Vulcanimicrobiaceae bacterium]
MPRKPDCSHSGKGRKCTASSSPASRLAAVAKAPFRTSGRRAGQRFDAQHGVTTEGLIFLSTLDPDLIGPAIEFATHYEPTPIAEAERLLAEIPEPLEETTFVDLGSGMGRVVLLAARRPFKTAVGVELSPTLHEVARDNFTRYGGEDLRCRDVRFVRADASEYRFPRGKLAVYLYNPFRAEIMRPVLAHLTEQRREITLLYHTPAERELVEAAGTFRIISDFGYGVVYRG